MKRNNVSRFRSMSVGRVSALVISLLWSGTLVIGANTYYVATNGTGNGDSWVSATNSIQGAIDRTSPNDTVLVSNGVYEVGGLTNYPAGGLLTNRVVIATDITVRSANNDPTNTIIKGAWDSTTTNGPAAVRCVYLSAGALIGFMLTNGATLASGLAADTEGGGVYVPANNILVISNCIIAGNAASYGGGGAFYGYLKNCTLVGNSAGMTGGGVIYSLLTNCTLVGNTSLAGDGFGGGARLAALYNCTIVSNRSIRGGGSYGGNLHNCTLVGNSVTIVGGALHEDSAQNCTLVGNSAAVGGGGVFNGNLNNCLIQGNTATYAGGSYNSTLNSCTVVSNSATTDIGGGVYYGALTDCIVYFNTAPAGCPNFVPGIGTLTYCCTAPLSDGDGNIDADPAFINANAGNYRLRAGSPCINAGTNGSWTTSYPYDLDGRMRVRYGRVDIGAYEFIHSGAIVGFH